MSFRRDKDDEWKWPHPVGIVSNIGRELAVVGTESVQLRYHASVCRPRWIASWHHYGTPEHAIIDGHPLKGYRKNATSPKSKLLTENKPDIKHVKMYRQFSKQPGQSSGKISRYYPKTTRVEENNTRYDRLEIIFRIITWICFNAEPLLFMYTKVTLLAERSFCCGESHAEQNDWTEYLLPRPIRSPCRLVGHFECHSGIRWSHHII